MICARIFSFYLDTHRVSNASEKLHMGTIKLARTLATPQEMGRPVIIETRGGIPRSNYC
jgi:hypothetical protein